MSLFLSRCGSVLNEDLATMTDGNIWAVPIRSAGFLESPNACVPATQLELNASLFIASHFSTRTSVHHTLQDITVERKQLINPYVDLVELPGYRHAQAQGLVETTLEGTFQPNRSPTGSSPPPLFCLWFVTLQHQQHPQHLLARHKHNEMTPLKVQPPHLQPQITTVPTPLSVCKRPTGDPPLAI